MSTKKTPPLVPPFPYFGGKRRATHLVWPRLGNPDHYLEPFFGGGAMLLGRPDWPHNGIETVNDLDCFVANFWRSVSQAPEEVERWANAPLFETDLAARHRWLLGRVEFRQKMKSDPFYYDSQVAGWWVWGLRWWIGSGWCHEGNRRQSNPHIGVTGGRRHFDLSLEALAQRLRRVRVACGDWSKLIRPSVTGIGRKKSVGVFLDPPYRLQGRDSRLYAEDSFDHEPLFDWCIANGHRPNLRIALCGYEGDYAMPEGWSCLEWKATGGYASLAKGKSRGAKNRARERIWFSPHCLDPTTD